MGTGSISARKRRKRIIEECKKKGLCQICKKRKARKERVSCRICGKKRYKKADVLKKKHICSLCKKEIFNKLKNSSYCKECADKRNKISHTIGGQRLRLKQEYPELSIEIRSRVKLR